MSMSDEELKVWEAGMVAAYLAKRAVPTADDAHKLYSADVIANEGRARGIVRGTDGKTYICTAGAHGFGGHDFSFGHECIPVSQRQAQHPEPVTYAERSAQAQRGLHPYGPSFDDGVTFKCKGVTWMILASQEVRFVKEAAPARLGGSQLELF